MVGHKLGFGFVLEDLPPRDSEIANMGIAISFQCIFDCLKVLSILKDNVNVDNGFRCQARHRRAANMFNTHVLPKEDALQILA